MASPNSVSSPPAERVTEKATTGARSKLGAPQSCGPPKNEPLFDALLRKAERRARPLLTRKERAAQARGVHYREFERLVITGELEIRMGFTLPLLPARRPATGAADRSRKRKRTESGLFDSRKRTRRAKEEELLLMQENELRRAACGDTEIPVVLPEGEETLVCHVGAATNCAVEEKKTVFIKTEPEMVVEELDGRIPSADSLVSIDDAQRVAEDGNKIDGETAEGKTGREDGVGSDVTADGEINEGLAIVTSVGEDTEEDIMKRKRVAAGMLSVRAPTRTEEEDEIPAAPVDSNYKYDGIGESPYMCAKCGTRTETASTMRMHIRREHGMNFMQIRPWHPAYMCTFSTMHRCGRVFASLHRLNVHVAKIHGRNTNCEDLMVKKSQVDTCEYCGLRVAGRAKGAVIGIRSHSLTHRYDALLTEINEKRERKGLKKWKEGHVANRSLVANTHGSGGKHGLRRRGGDGENGKEKKVVVINLIDE